MKVVFFVYDHQMMVIDQLRDEILMLKNQLDRKDIIDNLLDKLENKVSTPQFRRNFQIKPKLTDKCVNCDLIPSSEEE